MQVWDPQNGVPVSGASEFNWTVNAVPFQDDIVLIDMVNGAWSVQRCANEDLTACQAIDGGSLEEPIGLVADGANLWASDCAGGSVVQLIADGVALDEPLYVAQGLDLPEGIAVAADGQLLVAETGTGRLLAVDPTTRRDRHRRRRSGIHDR